MTKFIVSRASDLSDKNPPCEGAKKVSLKLYRDIRTFADKAEWLRRFPDDKKNALSWGTTKDGKPFRIVDGRHITLWVVNIPDVLRFIRKYGRCIIEPPSENYIGFENTLKIEIYDDYVE